jgi:hypothetical protein
MILVAVVAVLLGAGLGAVGLVRRARHFRQLEADHANMESSLLVLAVLEERQIALAQERANNPYLDLLSYYRQVLRNLRLSSGGIHPDADDGLSSLVQQLEEMLEQEKSRIEGDLRSALNSAQFFRNQAAFHARMSQKYRRAASRPWETVPPDPPPPTKPPEFPEPPAQPDLPSRKPEQRIEPRPFLTLAPARASRG